MLAPPTRADERAWLRWGVLVFAIVESVHFSGGLIANDWEGWGTFFVLLAFVVVTGVVIVALTYGLLVRWSLRSSKTEGNRAAVGALIAGVISVASYVLFFTWAPFLTFPAALLLGREGLARAREGHGGSRAATAGGLLGLASAAFGGGMLVYALFHDGTYPFGF